MWNAICCACVCLLACACSNDEGGGDEPVPAGTSIVTVNLSTGTTTRGTGDAEYDNELMHTWWVAFVDSKNKVAKMIYKDTTAIEEDHFQCEMSNGNYRMYAFANVTPAKIYGDTGILFEENATIPDISDVYWIDDLNLWTGNIPMSGYISRVQVAQNVAIDIEVVRLVAKLRFNVIDRTVNSTAVVNSITFFPVTSGNVPLFPDYATLGGAYTPQNVDELGYNSITLSSFEQVDERNTTTYAYIRESSALDSMPAPNPPGHFEITVNLTRNGVETENLYVLADELTSINRNDYVTIPLGITDYDLDATVQLYPPIGGYPAVNTVRQGEDYNITFGSIGKFVINLVVYDKGQDASALPIVPENVVIETEDPSSIFSIAPTIDPVTGEIIGELSTNTGTAVVTAYVTVKQSEMVSYTFKRILYINRV